ncbi:MAG: alpha/beta hydrolase [Lachnospiraceae bacterium]|nr:alpha/beta hydrolase [Lachnospiraceae bacterium]
MKYLNKTQLKPLHGAFVFFIAVQLPLATFLVNYQKILCGTLSVCMVILFLTALAKETKTLSYRGFYLIPEIIGALFGVLFLLTKWYTGFLVLLICAMFILLRTFFYLLLHEMKHWEGRIMASISLMALLGLYIGTNFWLVATAFNPMVYVGKVQKHYRAANAFHPEMYEDPLELSAGEIVYSNIIYGKTYPNSRLDIYESSVRGENKPTVIFIHGGGYIAGTKSGGQPFAKNNGLSKYFLQLLKSGYNVVSVDYCYAPKYPYPTQLKQVNQALKFLKTTGSFYGLDMNRVVLEGKSAGGNIAGMLALISTNQKVADSMNLKPVLSKDNIKAVVFASALLDNTQFSTTHNFMKDYGFYQYARAAFHSNSPMESRIAKKTDIISQVTKEFPPTYLSDGNYATFYSQAQALHRRLNKLGVENTLNLYSREQEVLPHAYEMNMKYKSTADNQEKTIHFLNIHAKPPAYVSDK